MKKITFLILAILFPALTHAEARQLFEFSYGSTFFLYDRDQNDINEFQTLDLRYLYHFNNERHFVWHMDTRTRIDFADSDRNRYLPNEAYLGFYNAHWEFKLGLQKVFWGSGLSYNPTDVLNRSDLQANYIVREKLSDPIVDLAWHTDGGSTFQNISWHVYALPYFLETPLPGNTSRFSLSGEQNGVPYQLADGQDVPDYWDRFAYASSLGLSLGPLDVMTMYAHGPARVPGYVLKVNTDGALELQPFYYTVDMLGMNAELGFDRLTLKAQGAYKNTNDNTPRPHDIQPVDDDAIPANSFEYLLGIDYEWPLQNKTDTWLLSVEYLGQEQDASAFSSPIFFDHDLQFSAHYVSQKQSGVRWTNGVIKDVTTREWVALSDFSFLIKNQIRLGTQLFYTHAADDSALTLFDNASFVKVYLSYAWGKKD